MINAGYFTADLNPLRMAASNSCGDTDSLVFLYGMLKSIIPAENAMLLYCYSQGGSKPLSL